MPDNIVQKLNVFRRLNLYRERVCTTTYNAPFILVNGQSCLNFTSNDYLGIAQDQLIKQAVSHASKQYGLGSTSSPAISGYSHAHRALEEYAANVLGRERVLLLNSGYHANIAILTSLANRHSAIFADKRIHASIIDGARLSMAKLYRYKADDHQHLIDLLLKRSYIEKIIISESVFSMNGSITDIDDLCNIKQKNNGLLIIDDAHGFGILDTKKYAAIDLLVVPLGKSAGSMGALVAGSDELIELLTQSARSWRYSTAIPPAICAATLKALQIIENEKWRHQRLMENISFFIEKAKHHDISLTSNDSTPIKTIVLGCNQKVMSIQKKMLNKGYFVSAIRPPTVANNSARLRISLSCMHKKKHISKLVHALSEALGGNNDSK